jgi:hypothetical protein
MPPTAWAAPRRPVAVGRESARSRRAQPGEKRGPPVRRQVVGCAHVAMTTFSVDHLLEVAGSQLPRRLEPASAVGRENARGRGAIGVGVLRSSPLASRRLVRWSRTTVADACRTGSNFGSTPSAPTGRRRRSREHAVSIGSGDGERTEITGTLLSEHRYLARRRRMLSFPGLKFSRGARPYIR